MSLDAPFDVEVPVGLEVQEVAIDSILTGRPIRKDMGDIESLAASIRRDGLLSPLTLGPGGQLLAGHRRLAALRVLGATEVRVQVAHHAGDALAAARIERDENTCRKAFTVEEAVRVGALIEKLEVPKAEERKAATQAQPGVGTVGAGKFPAPDGDRRGVRPRDVAGETVGMSGRTYQKAKAVLAAVDNPDLPLDVRGKARDALDEMNRTGKVNNAYRTVVALTKPPAESQPEQGRKQGGRPESLKNTHRPDPNRVVASTVLAAAVPSSLFEILEDRYEDLDRDHIEGWVSSLSEAINALTRLRTRLKKELTQ